MALLLPALGTGCKASSNAKTTTTTTTARNDDAVVTLDDLLFKPERVTVHAGHEVRWHWTGSIAHNVTFPSFASGTQTEGDYTHTFDHAGTFPYYCTLHTEQGVGMTGTVVVVE
jgi:plastocyanin